MNDALGYISGSGGIERASLRQSAGVLDRLQGRQQDFASALGIAQRGQAAGDKASPREAAQQFVAVALVQPILKQLRDANRTPAPFGPGQGEKMMGSLADAQVAQAMVRRADWAIVDRIERTLIEKSGKAVTA